MADLVHLEINNMKYLFTGAQGTGKTTVMNQLSTSMPTVQGITRKLIADGIQVNYAGSSNSQKVIFDAYYEALNKDTDYISERSLIDVLAYTNYLYDNNKCTYDELAREALLAEEWYKHNECMYIYFPIEFDIVYDGVRSMNKTYQKKIDDYIKQYLNKLNLVYITVHGTVEERVEQISKLIDITG
jgi:predicted ATPase